MCYCFISNETKKQKTRKTEPKSKKVCESNPLVSFETAEICYFSTIIIRIHKLSRFKCDTSCAFGCTPIHVLRVFYTRCGGAAAAHYKTGYTDPPPFGTLVLNGILFCTVLPASNWKRKTP